MAVANLKIADAIDRNKNSKNYDEVCKEILSNKQILAHIMKACVPEYQDVPLSEIPSYIEHDPLLNVSMDEDGLSNGSTKINRYPVRKFAMIFYLMRNCRIPQKMKESACLSMWKHKTPKSFNTPY